ncbi:C-C motif chemokine 36.1 [Cynoglossus semilaevis]|uniref:Eotaxin-like n=1 Tax=Cynoglossus semilaevis TaxID=244447 RepID=A0A3P8WRN6_CYNSE|nr:eotaxin-like [Cynoglossus semilaevis]
MKNLHLLLLCVLGAALLSSVLCINSLGPNDCCFNHYPRRVKKSLISSYYVTDFRCPKTGVIFVTQNKSRICVDPELSWVQGVMKDLDEKSF